MKKITKSQVKEMARDCRDIDANGRMVMYEDGSTSFFLGGCGYRDTELAEVAEIKLADKSEGRAYATTYYDEIIEQIPSEYIR